MSKYISLLVYIRKKYALEVLSSKRKEVKNIFNIKHENDIK